MAIFHNVTVCFLHHVPGLKPLMASSVLEEYQRAMERGDRPKEVKSRER